MVNTIIPVDSNPYTISAYIKANGTADTLGAYINIYWYNSSYTQVDTTQNYFGVRSNQWQRYISANITPPAGAAYAKVAAITYGQFDGYYDNIQLEQTPQARGYTTWRIHRLFGASHAGTSQTVMPAFSMMVAKNLMVPNMLSLTLMMAR